MREGILQIGSDLREFAKDSLNRHETMQAASRREGATTNSHEVRRTFVETSAPKAFANPPQKVSTAAPTVSAVTSTVSEGAFFTLIVDSGGDTYLQGGSVVGGNGGSDTIADYKVIDSVTGGTSADGNILYVQVSCTGVVGDGILLPGCSVVSATTGSAATLPDNQAFTAASYTGKNLYVEIGRWAEDLFYPSAPGNLIATGCVGSFSITRT